MEIPKGFIPKNISDVNEYLKPVKDRKIYGLDDLVLKKDPDYIKDFEIYTMDLVLDLNLEDIQEKIYVIYRNLDVIILKFFDEVSLNNNFKGIIRGVTKIREKESYQRPIFLFKNEYGIYVYSFLGPFRIIDAYKKDFGFEEVKAG